MADTLSRVFYTGNGATKQFVVPFPFLDREHVYVTVNGVSVTFSWINDGLVDLTAIPTTGAAIKLYRNTPRDNALVDWVSSSQVLESSLDIATLQPLYVAQECVDLVNDTYAAMAQRTNHVGEQPISTVTGLQTALNSKAPVDSPNLTGAPTAAEPPANDSSTRIATTGWMNNRITATIAGVTFVNNMSGNVTITKATVGLDNVDNTTDLQKPISTAVATALSGKASAIHGHSTGDITGLGDAATRTAGLSADNVYLIPSDGKYAALDGSKITNIPPGLRNSTRHTVINGPVSSGLPNFLAATYAALTVTTQNVSSPVPLVVTAAMGYAATGAVDYYGYLTSNLSWTVGANVTAYLPVAISAAGVVTAASPVTLKPNYQMSGAASTTAGQYTFNVNEMQMYLGDGTNANKVAHVIVGIAVSGASSITSTVAYAYNGYYESDFSTGMPAASTAVSKNHNIGTSLVRIRSRFKILTAIAGYSVGDIVEGLSCSGSSLFFTPSSTYTDLAGGFGVSTNTNITHKSTGLATSITASTSVGWQIIAERAF